MRGAQELAHSAPETPGHNATGLLSPNPGRLMGGAANAAGFKIAPYRPLCTSPWRSLLSYKVCYTKDFLYVHLTPPRKFPTKKAFKNYYYVLL